MGKGTLSYNFKMTSFFCSYGVYGVYCAKVNARLLYVLLFSKFIFGDFDNSTVIMSEIDIFRAKGT